MLTWIGTAFAYLKYLPLLKKCLTDMENILSALTAGPDKIPSADQIRLVLDDVRALLDSGLINIPGMDDKAVSDEIAKIEDLLGSAATNSLSNLVRFGTVAPSTASQIVANSQPAPVVKNG